MGLGSGIPDPGSGKNLFRIPYPGVKKAPDPGSATLVLSVQDGMHQQLRIVSSFALRSFFPDPMISSRDQSPGTGDFYFTSCMYDISAQLCK
jgi:hypothetical protein